MVRDIYTVDAQWDLAEELYGDADTLTADELDFWGLNSSGRPS